MEAQFSYTVYNGAVTITGCRGANGVVAIPSTIKGVPVTRITDQALLGCSSLTNITIPNGVTSIGDQAFSGCASLRGVTIPNSVTSIGH